MSLLTPTLRSLITPSGQVTEFKIPTDGGDPFGITVGPGGNLWFTEEFGNTLIPQGQLKAGPYRLLVISSSAGGVLDASEKPLLHGTETLVLTV